MINTSEDLIEQFPSRRRRSSTASARHERRRSSTISARYADSSTFSDDDVSTDSLCIDPISAASIAGNSEEFRLFQEELRKSKVVTAGGAKHLLKLHIEKQGLSIEKRRNLDPKLNKVKSWKLSRQQSKKNLKKGIDQGLQNLRSVFSNQ
mmetsp:Transcript_27466/g.41587  ORF Transcript_27466/g.41587 Transcript_27466/m.41587 type:complete len:150 (-) Transcript_27466:33-482(-)